MGEISVGIKFWLEGFNDFHLGKGDVDLLKAVNELNNLKDATEKVGYSYKYGWNKLKKIERTTKKPAVISQRGGKGGGGNAKLTEWGKELIQKFEQVENEINTLKNRIN